MVAMMVVCLNGCNAHTNAKKTATSPVRVTAPEQATSPAWVTAPDQDEFVGCSKISEKNLYEARKIAKAKAYAEIVSRLEKKIESYSLLTSSEFGNSVSSEMSQHIISRSNGVVSEDYVVIQEVVFGDKLCLMVKNRRLDQDPFIRRLKSH
jgi:hypothetical protein